MASIRKWALPVIILGIAYFLAQLMMASSPEVNRGRSRPVQQLAVEVQPLQKQDFQVVIDTYGVTEARTQTSLVSQVSGQVIQVSENLRRGAFFSKGEALLKIDPRDYKIEVQVAQAELASAKSALALEEAEAEIAKQDWKASGRVGDPPSLALRKPQLDAAAARLNAAKARVEKAQLNLERTTVVAPYDGRVLSKRIGLGQVVGQSTVIAEVFSSDAVEIRLPVKSSAVPFINLPESGESKSDNPKVELFVDVADNHITWQGEIVRVEGQIDQESRQLYVIAQVKNLISSDSTAQYLKVGQFVNAHIQGVVLADSFVLPRSSLTQDFQVSMMHEGKLVKRKVNPLWSDESNVVVRSELSEGEQLVMTPVSNVPAGTAIRDIAAPVQMRQGERQGKPKQQALANNRKEQGDKS